jgi:hypothetical protein
VALRARWPVCVSVRVRGWACGSLTTNASSDVARKSSTASLSLSTPSSKHNLSAKYSSVEIAGFDIFYCLLNNVFQYKSTLLTPTLYDKKKVKEKKLKKVKFFREESCFSRSVVVDLHRKTNLCQDPFNFQLPIYCVVILTNFVFSFQHVLSCQVMRCAMTDSNKRIRPPAVP